MTAQVRAKLPLTESHATRRVAASPSKSKGQNNTRSTKPNQSILSFFKKTESSIPAQRSDSQNGNQGNDLFISDVDQAVEAGDWNTDSVAMPPQLLMPTKDGDISFERPESDRFNESDGPVKRRKTNGQLLGRSLEITKFVGRESCEQSSPGTPKPNLNGLLYGSRLDVSHELDSSENSETAHEVTKEGGQHVATQPHATVLGAKDPPSSLIRESTSIAFEDFDEEDFIDEEALCELGEEFLERRYAEEQRRLESASARNDDDESDVPLPEYREGDARDHSPSYMLTSDAPPCPICNIALAGISAEQASEHVNNCLDGRPAPLPKPLVQPPGVRAEPSASARRFTKAAIARPGQQNPFSLGESSTQPEGSAFSKLMSGHAEDTAWATAAANEVASRGKPAFKRTCPFYKILPGFNICVDAFRYGAVQGCSAYFLSHFHSDHYIGLTSSWCHGPIYCSRVTANLVRQQLRVDSRWIVPLNFETTVEVPGTNGVFVTMIPANHCPGSSLFLYEKALNTGTRPKTRRVLHCGDFRACPAHVHHPLLKPNVVDTVTGKSREQRLDVCYLDTTYLTPKYAFPVQHEVIRACADMCVSLSKEQIDESDDWERIKRERAGAGMAKFIRSDSQLHDTTTTKELDEDGNAYVVGKEQKRRGKLLVVVGTYSIGKERICLGVAKALNSKIYATPGKQRICAALEDPELTDRLTSNPLEAQVHMQMIMEIRPETLADYLASYKPHFSRIVGFRPSGWNYRPPNSRFTDSPLVQTVLHSDNWKSRYTMAELLPQRGSTREASCFGVPYSEHSSFRELTMFCCALNIDKIIPTVNVGSAKSRERMKSWFEKWEQERKKNGLFKVVPGSTAW